MAGIYIHRELICFLKNHDLRGKIIYPFVTNEGWAGHALQDFATNLSGGCVKSGMNMAGIYIHRELI